MLDYGCIVYGTAPNTNLPILDSITDIGLNLILGAFNTNSVISIYLEAHEESLEERPLKPVMHYYPVWKLMPAPSTWYIMLYMNLTQPKGIYIFTGQME